MMLQRIRLNANVEVSPLLDSLLRCHSSHEEVKNQKDTWSLFFFPSPKIHTIRLVADPMFLKFQKFTEQMLEES